MIKRFFFITIFILTFLFYLFPTVEGFTAKSSISKNELKLGEQAIFTFYFQDSRAKDAKPLWNSLYISDNNIEVISYKDMVEKENLVLEVVFASYEPGDYKDVYLEINLSINDQVLIKLTTEKYDIKVSFPLTEEEIQVIKKIDDKTKIELKKEKEQAEIPFQFAFYLKVIFFIILTILLIIVAYYIFYKILFKKNNLSQSNLLPPYEDFLAKVERITFNKDQSRSEIELKLSELTEILKELIYRDFSLNAPSETTRELVISLRELSFEPQLIINIRSVLEEIDLIKFAKAPYDIDRLLEQKEKVKKIGSIIHQYSESILREKESEAKVRGK